MNFLPTLETLDPNLTLLLACAGAGFVFFLGFLVARLAWDRRQSRRDRTRQDLAGASSAMFSLDLARSGPPHDAAARFDQYWDRLAAGTGLELTGAAWLGLMLAGGAGLAAGAYLWREDFGLVVAAMLAGLGGPLVALLLTRHRLRRQIQQQLPEALFFIARSLRAGLSFEQAVGLAAAECPAPLANELRRVADQLRLGLAPRLVFEGVADRIGLPDLHAVAAALALHQNAGGNLALLLDRLAAGTRDRNQYLGYFRSATALGRLTALAIGGAVPVLFVGYWLFEPEVIQRFLASSTGLMLLAIAFGLELVGILWLAWLLRVDY